MKQVIFFLASAICFFSCNNAPNTATGKEEQIKIKLLKQAGLDKMDKAFTYEYSLQNDSIVGMLDLVPASGLITLKDDELTKGKLLNAFITPDGHQYNTLLMRRGSTYVTRVVSIDGNVFEENVFIEPQFPGDGPGGNPPPLCSEDCNDKCMQICENYYQRSIFPTLQDSANRTCKTIYYRYMCPLGAKSCHFDMFHVFMPDARICYSHLNDPGRIVARKLASGLRIKNQETQK